VTQRNIGAMGETAFRSILGLDGESQQKHREMGGQTEHH
jgi:hypothetical protein